MGRSELLRRMVRRVDEGHHEAGPDLFCFPAFACVSAYMNVCAHGGEHMCVYVCSACMRKHAHVHACVCMGECMHVLVYTCEHMHVHISVSMCVVCMHMHVYAHE